MDRITKRVLGVAAWEAFALGVGMIGSEAIGWVLMVVGVVGGLVLLRAEWKRISVSWWPPNIKIRPDIEFELDQQANESAPFVENVLATVTDSIASNLILEIYNPAPERAVGVSVSIAVEHEGSKTTQKRTVNVPAEGSANLAVQGNYPTDPYLKVKGAVEYEGHSEPFCFKYSGLEDQQFVLCGDDTLRQMVMKADPGDYSLSGADADLDASSD